LIVSVSDNVPILQRAIFCWLYVKDPERGLSNFREYPNIPNPAPFVLNTRGDQKTSYARTQLQLLSFLSILWLRIFNPKFVFEYSDPVLAFLVTHILSTVKIVQAALSPHLPFQNLIHEIKTPLTSISCICLPFSNSERFFERCLRCSSSSKAIVSQRNPLLVFLASGNG